MKAFWLILLMYHTLSFGQEYSAIIVDDNGQTLQHVQVRDTSNNVIVFSQEDGAFTIPIESNSLFELSLAKFDTIYLNPEKKVDTIQMSFESRLLNSVLINSDAIKPVLDDPGINVLDYLVFEEFVLTLYTSRSERFLSLEGQGEDPSTFSLGKLKAKSLFRDCFGNAHLLTKDKAYRLSIGQELSFVAESSLHEFNEIVKPCVAAIGPNLIISDYSNHKKKYTLAVKNKAEKQFTPFFNVWDHESEVAANALYWEIVAAYMGASDTVSDIIKNGMWDGVTMRELAINGEILALVGFYDGVIGKEILVESFQAEERLVSFDLCFDSLHVFDQTGEHLSGTGLRMDLGKADKTVLLDHFRNEFYIMQYREGICTIYPVDVSRSELGESFQLSEIPFPKNVQIFDGWLYFMKPISGFHKLYKTKI